MTTANDSLDILVIGAGQAGLAIGRCLKQTPYRFRLIERNSRVGDSWRKRYDSLVLFTPRAYSALPGLKVPGDPEGYPGKDEIADYLESYAEHFELPVTLGMGIRSLERVNGHFRVTRDDGAEVEARAVVLAMGAFQKPAIPAISKGFSKEVLQHSPETYKNPAQLPFGRVLVVGDGATGRQIAKELAATHEALLATGRLRKAYPARVLGRSLFWWLDKLGILSTSRESAVGRFLMKTDNFPGKDLELSNLQKQGVKVVGRLGQAEGQKVTFTSGEQTEVEVVLWATGYKDDTDRVAIPEAKDAQGNFLHHRGVSPVANLYFIGKSWQWTRGSALLAGVGADAQYLVEHLLYKLALRA
jgi:putative flavoprotein involved in K+ transport